jgi:two-component system chemotaxis response regulator CheY
MKSFQPHGLRSGLPTASDPSEGTSMARILIVDDTVFVRTLLRDLLEGKGYEVLEAADGRDGAAVFREKRPDLVITDLTLPVVGGHELVRLIREHSPKAKIIVLSGSLPGARPAKPLPPDIPFVQKPFSASPLLSTVAALLDGRSAEP